MWAQLITMQLKPGKDGELAALIDQLRAAEQPNSGLVRSLALRDQKDPQRVSFLVVFESEERARARESNEQRQTGLDAARATMAEIFDGAPEFVDFEVVDETVG
jgi:quinol monooxygenase YgiN